MYNPHFDKAMAMVRDLVQKHIGELNALDFRYENMEVYYPQYDKYINQPVPRLVMDFK